MIDLIKITYYNTNIYIMIMIYVIDNLSFYINRLLLFTLQKVSKCNKVMRENFIANSEFFYFSFLFFYLTRSRLVGAVISLF